MSRGDHISVVRSGYSHHAIDYGDGSVIEFSGEPDNKLCAIVQQTSLEDFARGAEVRVHEYSDKRFDPDETVARALSLIGSRDYNLLTNNCEHFACWCVTGERVSAQVVVVRVATCVVSTSYLGGAAALSTVSGAGVSGLGGSGVMSGLKAIGSVVGCGAVGGLVIAASIPAVWSFGLTAYALRDDEFRTDAERRARRVGRVAAGIATPVAVAGVVGAVDVFGKVAGLSAAGISSGLSAIGGAGGMAAGVAMSAAIPVLAVALIGYVAYRVARWAHGVDWTPALPRVAPA
jgi:hypothetical protein